MAAKKKSNPAVLRNQLIILSGFLMLAVLALLIIPKTAPAASDDQLNEYELRERMSGAADAYMLGKTHEERQAAAREIAALRGGSRSVPSNNYQQLLDFLRVLVFITIVFLAWRINILVFKMYKPGKVSKA